MGVESDDRDYHPAAEPVAGRRGSRECALMCVLLVEDDPLRVAWFRAAARDCQIDHVRTVPEAITLLESEFFDQLWLDHDLNTEPAAGRDVATWLVAHPDCLPQLRIYTHTVNTVSGPKIVRDLEAAGRFARWMPYHDVVTLYTALRAPSSDDGAPREITPMRD